MKKKSHFSLLIAIIMLFTILLAGGCGKKEQGAEIRVGTLKGPTTIGMLSLMEKSANDETVNHYDFTMVTKADELTAMMVKGDLDIALVPANVASILYHKTDGGVAVLDINTLGVLYMVTAREDITDIKSLAGKTIYLTGKGTTPDYALQYLLVANGMSTEDVTLEYASEATEVAAILAQKPEAVGLLPEPFVTVACAQNENLSVCLSMTEEWDKVAGNDSRMVTGVTVVRKEFLEEHEGAVRLFIEDHKASTEYTGTHLDETAALCVAQEIIAKEPIAKKAIPQCNITCITGEEMKNALSGYLGVLADLNPQSVGNSIPGDDFYYEY